MYALLWVLFSCEAPQETTTTRTDEQQRWEAQAERVRIVRDAYGIPHIYGKTDADVVFGLLYAQCEDDFNRVERNYINGMGRLAESEGEREIFRDLRMKLFIDPADMQQKYAESPEWLKTLMDAFADGINYYLYKHPEVTPRVIQRFEPWMALTFTEGSIGTDIEQIPIQPLKAFYAPQADDVAYNVFPKEDWQEDSAGSNGFAVAPANTANGNALFVINPHTSFFFRSEVHLVSEEGLNAYGAVTWGQFFLYQGFNERLGWMHTSTYADAMDAYLETIVEKDGSYYYRYGDEERKVEQKTLRVPYKGENGMEEREFTAYFTHHGPIVRAQDDAWVAMKLMERPIDALTQSYNRMKCRNFEEFEQNMNLRTNSSNNTVYADADGTIAYYHGNFMPRRDTQFDFSKPVDGSNPATEWQGLHELSEMIRVVNPPNGWIQNCNATPFSVIGEGSPKAADYPSYMATEPENYRGILAVRLLKDRKDFTLEGMIELAYNPYLVGFERLLPMLFAAYENAAPSRKEALKEPIAFLKAWDKNAGEASAETSLAIFWGQHLLDTAHRSTQVSSLHVYTYIEKSATPDMLLTSLEKAVAQLTEDFGSWKVPFGELNRYQRLTGDIVQKFNDDAPSMPIGFASARWGALASFGAGRYPGTKKMYGTHGNSFVAFVEFGEKVRAKSITVGGLSSDPTSPHFSDQVEMFANAEFKDVCFYSEDVEANAKRTYRPGE